VVHFVAVTLVIELHILPVGFQVNGQVSVKYWPYFVINVFSGCVFRNDAWSSGSETQASFISVSVK